MQQLGLLALLLAAAAGGSPSGHSRARRLAREIEELRDSAGLHGDAVYEKLLELDAAQPSDFATESTIAFVLMRRHDWVAAAKRVARMVAHSAPPEAHGWCEALMSALRAAGRGELEEAMDTLRQQMAVSAMRSVEGSEMPWDAAFEGEGWALLNHLDARLSPDLDRAETAATIAAVAPRPHPPLTPTCAIRHSQARQPERWPPTQRRRSHGVHPRAALAAGAHGGAVWRGAAAGAALCGDPR